MSGQLAGKYFRLVNVFTSDSKVRKTLQGYFLCMARTGDDGYILFGNTVYLVKIIGNNQVLVRDNTFDSSDNELVLYFGFQLFQVAFQIGRGGNEYQGILFLYYLVDI